MKVIRYSGAFKLQAVREVETGEICAQAVERKYDITPIFDSLKCCFADVQRLAKTPNGLGTTFPSSGHCGHGFSRNVGGRATPAAMNALCACPST